MALIAAFLITGIGRFGFVHRYLSHKNFQPHFIYKVAGLYLAVLSLTNLLPYAAIHRRHHEFSDTDKDSHNANKIKYFSVFLEQINFKMDYESISDLVNDSLIMWFSRNRIKLIFFTYLLIICLDSLFNFELKLVTSLILFPNVFQMLSAFLIFKCNHTYGYVNFNTGDNSKNTFVLTLLLGIGEHLHNNHHAKPWKVSFSEKWWEIDFVGFFNNLFSLNNSNQRNTNKVKITHAN
ncbi:MAG: fatty acid desaturase [Pseudobdellovibrio sp.]